MIVDENIVRWDGKLHKSNHSQMFLKIGVYKNFAIVTGKHLC